MIANKLRSFFTTCWLSIASPVRSGSIYHLKTQPVLYGGLLAPQIELADREAMKAHLTDTYGIRQIED